MPSFIGFIPTQPEYVSGFFELVNLLPSDVVYDLGSGDGRLLFAALEKGAGRVIGIDIDPERVLSARENAVKKGFQDRATFIESDVLNANLADASVVFCYLCTAASEALKPKFESELKTGTRVVMESFPVPGWQPSKTYSMGYKTFYLYVIPPAKE
jgi:ribosomal protein L11 methylase PrmA